MAKLTQVQYELLKPGVYDAVVDSVDEDHSKMFDKDQYKFVFRTSTRSAQVLLFVWCSAVLSPNSKLASWASTIIHQGKVLPENIKELDTNDFIGKSCQLVVSNARNKAGIEQNRIESILPADADD